MTMLYLPIAPPAAGKSTLAGLMVDAGVVDVDAVVCPDTFRRVLTGDTSNQEENALVFKMVDHVVRARLKYGLTVFLDATNLNGQGRRDMIEIAGEHGAHVAAITWDVTLDECLERNAARARTIPVDVIERMYESYSFAMEERVPHEPYNFVFTADGLMKSCEDHIEAQYRPKADVYPLAQAHADERTRYFWVDFYGECHEVAE